MQLQQIAKHNLYYGPFKPITYQAEFTYPPKLTYFFSNFGGSI